MPEGQDFIVSELLSELKEASARKDTQIKSMHKLIAAIVLTAVIAILSVVGGFLWYLNQYDFSSTSTVAQTAEGVYALIDSEGNTIAWDITPEELQQMLEVIENGESQDYENDNS